MWWLRQPLAGARPLLPQSILEVVACAYSIVEVGGLDATGPQRGRDFEQLFYKMCDRRGVSLSERVGARTIAAQRSASGFQHEIDAASRGAACTTCWELKHLSGLLEKNELLIFNGKALDYLVDGSTLFRRTPLLRFLLSGSNIRDDCRVYSVQWAITVIEPGRIVIPMMYEAMIRGLTPTLSKAELEAVGYLVPWAARSAQKVVTDFAARCDAVGSLSPPSMSRRAKEVIDLQEQLGPDVLDCLEEHYPDWVNEVAQKVWDEIGGWT